METDQGWFTGEFGDNLCLRYYDKETGNTILLCNKPECAHDGGNQCEATYEGLTGCRA